MDSRINGVDKITIRSDRGQGGDGTDRPDDSLTLTLEDLKARLDEWHDGRLGLSGGERRGGGLDGRLDANHQAQSEYTVLALYRTLFQRDWLPSFFEVCAADGFYARIPMGLAEHAVLVFPQRADEPPTSGQRGVRLFVRESESACLNVKSIVDVLFGRGEELNVPTFGSKLPGNPKVCKNQP